MKQDYVNIIENADNNPGIYAWENIYSQFDCLCITVRFCTVKDCHCGVTL